MAGPVFISHSSRDVEIARGICDAIEKRGVPCWISGRDVDLGDHYGDAIVAAIERARAMVLVFSGNANHSAEIKKEIALASKLGVAVFPVRIEDIEPTGAFRYELMTRQWIDLFADWDQALKKLTERIAALPASAKPESEAPPQSKPELAPPALRPAPPPRRLGAAIGAVVAVVVLLAAGGVFWARSGSAVDPPRVQTLASQGGTNPSAPAPAPAAPTPASATAVAATAPPAPPAPASIASAVSPPAATQPAPKLVEAVVAAPAQAATAPVAVESAPKSAEATPAPASAPQAVVVASEAPAAQPAVALVSSPTAPSPSQPPPVRSVANDRPASAPAPSEVAPVQPEKPAPKPILIASLAAGGASAGVGDGASTAATLVAPAPAVAPKAATEPQRAATDESPKPIVRAALATPSSDPPPATPSPAPLAGPAPVVDPAPAPAAAAPPAPTKPLVVASLAPTVQADKRPPADAAAKTFKDCAECPEMVVVPAGSALVGSPPQETARMPHEAAPGEAVIPAPLAIGRSDVTFDEWEACVAAGGCNNWLPGDFGWGRGRQPVIFVSWSDAHAYVAWLSAKTGKPYRLLSETEWEYAARGCTTTACANKPFWFGSIKPEIANYDSRYAYEGSPKGLSRRRAVAADEGPPNPFGLLNMVGNVRQWVEDCWSANPGPPPAAGAPRLGGDCSERVTRGGSYDDKPQELRAAARSWQTAETRSQKIGFRVARALDP